ncbi:MAG: (2Fe-2S)-binding protein [Acidobacteria bacterium]|nr:(2Fe-2S)-binding protein [Acidobacteriota bacterium]
MKRLSGGVRRGASINIVVNGEPVRAHLGESVATALLADGRRVLRRTVKRGAPRGLFCGMGVCFDCVVTIDGTPGMRGCVTAVRDGMRIETESPDVTRTR